MWRAVSRRSASTHACDISERRPCLDLRRVIRLIEELTEVSDAVVH